VVALRRRQPARRPQPVRPALAGISCCARRAAHPVSSRCSPGPTCPAPRN